MSNQAMEMIEHWLCERIAVNSKPVIKTIYGSGLKVTVKQCASTNKGFTRV